MDRASEKVLTVIDKQEWKESKLDSVDSLDKIDINPSLGEKVRRKYINLLREFKDLFIYKMEDIGNYKGPEKYSITLTTNRPQKGPTYPIPLHLQEQFKSHISDLLRTGLIEPCYSTQYNHGFIPVAKRDGGIRWASDCRLLNAITEDDSYTLPKIFPLLREMVGNRF